MTIREIGEELFSHSQDVFGSDLRTVIRYNKNEHDPIFTREDILDQIKLDDDTRPMLRLPLVRMQNSAQDLSEYHPTLDSLDVAVYSYGDITLLQFPITDTDGIIVTIDGVDSLPNGYVSRCKSIALD